MWMWPPPRWASPGGFGAERPPSLGASSTQRACPAVPGLPGWGGLRPCWRLVRINKQIPWICGFFGPAAPAGRRPAAVPKAAPQGAAGRRSVTNHGTGTRVISIAVQTSPRQSERRPLRSCLPRLCFQLPPRTLPTLPRAAGMLLPPSPQHPPQSIPRGERLLPAGRVGVSRWSPTPRGCF